MRNLGIKFDNTEKLEIGSCGLNTISSCYAKKDNFLENNDTKFHRLPLKSRICNIMIVTVKKPVIVIRIN